MRTRNVTIAAVAIVLLNAALCLVTYGSITFRGAKCVAASNCANCLAESELSGFCKLAPNTQCWVGAASAAGTLSAKECQRSGNSADTCGLPQALMPMVTCSDTKWWNCGCANGDGECGVVSCSCTGAEDGTFNFTHTLVCI